MVDSTGRCLGLGTAGSGNPVSSGPESVALQPGVLALEPVARRLAPDAPPWPADWRSRPVLALAGLHVVVVLVVSRVAGLRDDLEGALVISAVVGALALVALVALVRDVERVPGDG